MPMDIKAWRIAFQAHMDNPPKGGEILTTNDGKLVRLKFKFPENSAPCIYGLAFVPSIVGQPPAWYARSFDDNTRSGYKIILLPNSRNEVIKRFGIMTDLVGVKSLRVIKIADTKRSLIGEVAEWE